MKHSSSCLTYYIQFNLASSFFSNVFAFRVQESYSFDAFIKRMISQPEASKSGEG